MAEEQKPPVPSDIDYGLLFPFMAHVVLLQAMILIVRITTSYRAIELGLPVFWLGIIATGFAIIPVFSAVRLGRWIDRGGDHVVAENALAAERTADAHHQHLVARHAEHVAEAKQNREPDEMQPRPRPQPHTNRCRARPNRRPARPP